MKRSFFELQILKQFIYLKRIGTLNEPIWQTKNLLFYDALGALTGMTKDAYKDLILAMMRDDLLSSQNRCEEIPHDRWMLQATKKAFDILQQENELPK